MIRSLLLVFIVSFISLSSFAVKREITISFRPLYNGEAIEEKWYRLPSGDSLSVEMLRWYISGIGFQKNGKTVFRENSYYLPDINEPGSLDWKVAIPASVSFDELVFNLGIDSITNIAGAGSGVLDATNGMYWAWQSGYINFKLEGKSNLCKTRKNEYQFHIGGYMPGQYAMQQVRLAVANTDSIVINLPLEKLFKTIELKHQNSIMIPCAEAVDMARTIAGLFEVSVP